MYLNQFLHLLKLPFIDYFPSIYDAFMLMSDKYFYVATGGVPIGFDRIERASWRINFIKQEIDLLDQKLANDNLDSFYMSLSGIDLNLRGLDFNLFDMYNNVFNIVCEKSEKDIIADIEMIETGLLNFEKSLYYLMDLIHTQPWLFTKKNKVDNVKPLYSQDVEYLLKKIPGISAIEQLQGITWSEFEDLVGAFFLDLGFKVFKTNRIKDGGFDLLIIKSANNQFPERILIECKKYEENKVGVNLVRELYGVSLTEPTTGGICVTSSQFTRGAKEFSRITNGSVNLVDGNSIISWFKQKINH